MFDWNLLVFAWLIVAGLCVGFGWAVGAWIAESLKRGQNP